MGAYLSKPNKETVCESGGNSRLSFGAASMQGWRVKQEDAHNALPDYHESWALFAVYDGHGGADVSTYTAAQFPDMLLKQLADVNIDELVSVLPTTSCPIVNELPIKTIVANEEAQTNGKGDAVEASAKTPKENGVSNGKAETRPELVVKMDKLMSVAFLEFDDHLRQTEAMSELRTLAGKDSDDEMVEDNVDPSELYQEAHMPLQEVLRQYGVVLVKNKSGKKFLTKEKNVDVDGETVGSGKRKSRVVEDEAPCIDISIKRAKVGDHIIDAPIVLPVEQTNGKAQTPKDEKVAVEGQKTVEAVDGGQNEAAQKTAESKTSPLPTDGEDGGGGSASKLTTEEEKTADESSNDGDYVDGQEEEEEEEGDSSSDDDEAIEGEGEPGEELDGVMGKGDMLRMLARRLQGDGDDSESSDEEEDDDGPPLSMPSGDTPGEDSGCTACVALVSRHVVCIANAGDSRAVMCREGACIELSYDHKPDDPVEKERIHIAGGRITPDGRVNGGLNLSRAIGDHFYKKNTSLPLSAQMITADPDVVLQRLTPLDEFIVIACDGIWNSMSSASVVTFVRDRLREGKSAMATAELLCQACLAEDTEGDGTGCDNMTVLVVLLNHD